AARAAFVAPGMGLCATLGNTSGRLSDGSLASGGPPLAMAYGSRPSHDGIHGVRRDGPDALRALHGHVGHQGLRRSLGHRAYASPVDEARIVPLVDTTADEKEDFNMRKRTSTPGILDMPQHAVSTSASGELSRRYFCQASAVGLMAGAIATGKLTSP